MTKLSSVAVTVVQDDALRFQADVLVLKYAQALWGRRWRLQVLVRSQRDG